jgi:Glycosyl transferases group 1
LKAKIVIASTLKPIIDPRAYEKIGISLANTGLYDVHLIGPPPTLAEAAAGISLYPFKKNISSPVKRFIIPWQILKLALQIKPEVLIINTHELLFVGVIFKLFSGKKLIYDIRENYFFNLVYQKNYPWGGRHLLAIYVRTKEVLLAVMIDHFLLAEQCYAQEIKFIGNRYSVLENKFKPPVSGIVKAVQHKITFLLSGTISREYGVFEAIRFMRQLPADKYQMIIIGHCPNRHTLSQLKNYIKADENIDLQVSATPIPHAEIIARIGDKTIGLLPYQFNKSTVNKLPTKLYEYLGLGIPLLISPNPRWQKLLETYQAGLSYDFNKPAEIDHISRIITLINQCQPSDLKDIMWSNEEIKLTTLMKDLLSPE